MIGALFLSYFFLIQLQSYNTCSPKSQVEMKITFRKSLAAVRVDTHFVFSAIRKPQHLVAVRATSNVLSLIVV